MKKFILFILIFNFNFAYSFENVVVPDLSSATTTSYSAISNEEFSDLEYKIFKKAFKTDSADKRLERLEKEIFGMLQKGSEEERFENLITASEYYQSGYRQSQSVAESKAAAKNKKNYINPKDYITNYNFDEIEPVENKEYTYKVQSYNDDIIDNKATKGKSRIMQFFSDLADIISAGAITGYTLPIDSFNTGIIGGSNFYGYPHFPTYIPQYNNIRPYRYNRSPYVTRNNYYNPPPPHRFNYYPNNTGLNKNSAGSGVKIMY